MFIELDMSRLNEEQKSVVEKMLKMGTIREVSWKDCFASEKSSIKRETTLGYPIKTLERASELFKYALVNKADEYVDNKRIDEAWTQYINESEKMFGSYNEEVVDN